MKVSVIVAVYNGEEFIGRCLRSLVRQSMSQHEYEIIAVDDGSTDRTAYALSQFSGDVRVETHERNRGLPSAINSGLRVASGKYIVRVDADDFVNANFLTVLEIFLDSNLESQAVACDYLMVDDNEDVISREDASLRPIACGVMFRRSAMNDVGSMNEAYLMNEEREYRRRFEKLYSIDHLPIPLYRYRRHENNMTNDLERKNHYDDLLESADI